MSLSPVELGYVVLVGTTLLIATPLATWSVVLLRRDWNAVYIVKRHKYIISFMLFITCITEFGMYLTLC